MKKDRNDEKRGRSRTSGGRGFASMDPEERREVSRRGGEASHRSGHAHEWTAREARRYGAEGGRASHRSRSRSRSRSPVRPR